MAIDPVGTALGVAGLLLAFKGAVDGYLLIESFFAKDIGLKDLASRFHVERQELEEWADQFNLSVADSDPQNCILQYDTPANKQLIFEILDRIKKRLVDAQRLISSHTGDDVSNLKRRFRILDRDDGQKNRIKWAIKNKAKLEEIVTALHNHHENLLRRSKIISTLQPQNWGKVERWLTKVDQYSHHARARRLWQEGTCQWLFHRSEYTDWLSAPTRDTLWINAIPGAGKTILASTIIDKLGQTVKPSIGIAYFYCDYRDPENQTSSEILGTLCAQLSRQNLAFRFAVWQHYDASKKTYNASRSVDEDTLADILGKHCVEFDQVLLVLDAMDECPIQERPKLLKCLKEVQKQGNGRIRVLVTSRPTVDIQKAFEKMPKIPILSDSNSADIELYIKEELEKAIKEKPDWLGDEEDTQTMRARISTRVVDKANGMFLFAKLQLDILRNCHSKEDVSAALDGLPEDLDKTWVRLLEDVHSTHRNPRNPEKIKRILQWLVAAARPLKVDEIKEAIAVEQCQLQRNPDAEIRDLQILIGLSGPLVRMNSETNELYLAHFSLKEFLLSGKLLNTSKSDARKYNIEPQEAETYLATVSLTYLSFREFSRPCQSRAELEDLRKKHRFLDYVSLYGGTHLGRIDAANHALISLLNGLFVPEISCQERPDFLEGTDTTMLTMTISAYPVPMVPLPGKQPEYSGAYGGLSISMDSRCPQQCLEFLARQTIKRIEERPNCKSWLQRFRTLSDVTMQDHPANITPLYFASLFGWNAGVDQLLELSNSPATTSDLNHALRAAAMGNNCIIIKKLQNAGARVNAHSAGLGSALQSAAWCGQVEAVETLLALGATVEEPQSFHRPGGTVGSALQGAAVRGDTKIVRTLLDHGANVNSNRGWLGTPLQAVLEKGNKDMALLLIQSAGFDGSITGGYYGSALRLTCLDDNDGMQTILQAMLDRGAPASQRVGPYGNLLEIATNFGFHDKLQLLLANKASIDDSLGQFGNAIHSACINGNKRMVKALLDHGANPNCPGHWLGKEYASRNLPGQPEYGKILVLQEGEGFLGYGHSGMTKSFFAPTLKAAKRLKTVEHNKIYLLLENEPSHQNGHLGYPLQAAAFRGHTAVLELLIESGSAVNAVGGFFGTALQAAASQGFTDAVKVLLENSADPNLAPAGHYGSALSAAIALNFGDVAQALLENGADPFAKDEHGWDASTWSTLLHRDLADILSQAGTTANVIPSAWSSTNKSPKLEINACGNEVRFLGSMPTSQGQAAPFVYRGIRFELGATVIADHPISPYQDYYFEMKILTEGNTRTICIGLSEKDIPSFKLPGHSAPHWGYRGDDGGCFADIVRHERPDQQWPHGASYGYHGDDGRCFAEDRKLDQQWPMFTAGDVVGCGVEWGQNRIFFTLNGTRLEPNVPITRRRLYPALGIMAENAVVHTNFGEEPFLYSSVAALSAEFDAVLV